MLLPNFLTAALLVGSATAAPSTPCVIFMTCKFAPGLTIVLQKTII